MLNAKEMKVKAAQARKVFEPLATARTFSLIEEAASQGRTTTVISSEMLPNGFPVRLLNTSALDLLGYGYTFSDDDSSIMIGW